MRETVLHYGVRARLFVLALGCTHFAIEYIRLSWDKSSSPAGTARKYHERIFRNSTGRQIGVAETNRRWSRETEEALKETRNFREKEGIDTLPR